MWHSITINCRTRHTDSWYQGEFFSLIFSSRPQADGFHLRIVKVPGLSFRTANTASTFQLDSSALPPTRRSRLSPAGRTIFPRFDRRNNLCLGCKRGMSAGNGITHGECRRASRQDQPPAFTSRGSCHPEACTRSRSIR